MRDLVALLNARKAGDGWMAKCPAHDDRKPSLSIGQGADGRWLVRCQAGCTLDAILDKLGLATADLFPEKNGNGGRPTLGPIVATYDYPDESGELLQQSVRYPTKPDGTKDFRQRRPDGAGGWLWKVGDVRRVPYRLPELKGKPAVMIGEGEKDCDRLWSLGLPATTNAGGAGKWKEAHTTCLVQAGVQRVCILPDNDGPGRVHAETVARSCHGAGLQVKVVELPGLPEKGDVSDWFDAGHTKAELIALVKATLAYTPLTTETTPTPERDADPATEPARTLHLTPASAIRVRPVRWLWTDRIPLGSLALLGGREGVGKTLCAYTLAASVTRGTLDGEYRGTPRSVIVAASEDSWEHTIVPRLMAAGADLDRVYRVDVVTSEGIDTALSLPRDLLGLERSCREVQAALVILDPLLSRLEAALDTHKDQQVRLALEPLVRLADAVGVSVLGVIHVNKSASTDVLTTLMASRAFAAVARAVLIVMADPDDDAVRLLGQAKNNLGRMDLPTLTFTIVGALVATTDEGEVWTGKVEWTGNTDRTITEAVDAAAASAGDRTATAEAADWLLDYLTSEGGTRDSATIKREGQKAGHHAEALRRARQKLHVSSDGRGFPRQTYWTLPASRVNPRAFSSRVSPGETHNTTNTTNATEEILRDLQSRQTMTTEAPGASVASVALVVGEPPRDDTTRASHSKLYPEPVSQDDDADLLAKF